MWNDGALVCAVFCIAGLFVMAFVTWRENRKGK